MVRIAPMLALLILIAQFSAVRAMPQQSGEDSIPVVTGTVGPEQPIGDIGTEGTTVANSPEPATLTLLGLGGLGALWKIRRRKAAAA